MSVHGGYICQRRRAGLHIVVTVHDNWDDAWATALLR